MRGPPLNKWRSLLGKTEFHFFLACLTFIAFIWPFLAVPNLSDNFFIFAFLYGIWFLVIAVHLIMDFFSADDSPENK